jgi:hypothetical protein
VNNQSFNQSSITQVRGENPMGGRDEGWGARAFVLYDWIPVSV